MFGRGKTLVPGRTLDPSHFTVLSKARDRQIMLPRADKDYRIVSRQALEFTDLTKPRDAVVRGTLTITDSEALLGSVEVPDTRREVRRQITARAGRPRAPDSFFCTWPPATASQSACKANHEARRSKSFGFIDFAVPVC
jgi:hypothetical protein